MTDKNKKYNISNINNNNENNNISNINQKNTILSQKEVEDTIKDIFKDYEFKTSISNEYNNDSLCIYGDKHIHLIMKSISDLPSGYASLDSGLPWFAYWTLNIFNLFSKNNYELNKDLKLKFIDYLSSLQHEEGGFMGYSNSLPHIISNYSAVLALISLDCEEAYNIIDRKKMYNFLLSMKSNKNSNKEYLKDKKENHLLSKNKDTIKISDIEVNNIGSFQVHKNGESDLRATYCAITVAYILNILDDDLLEGVVENIASCQTYEGGLGPEPYSESHGGYNFCGIATLILLNKLELIDIDCQLNWLVNRQMKIEGGFQGRTNKLVDSCYSFWQGSVFAMLLEYDSNKFSLKSEMLYDSMSLQAYIMMACQLPSGGIVDKPGKYPDLYHLNYAGVGYQLSQKLSELDINESSITKDLKNKKDSNTEHMKYSNNLSYTAYLKNNTNTLTSCISYHESTELENMDPVFCVTKDILRKAINFYHKLNN